jgi:hypothetical protein
MKPTHDVQRIVTSVDDAHIFDDALIFNDGVAIS